MTESKPIIPNLFILGAPKAGTTALDAYLRKHPNVFMCRKEAHFFCRDFPGNINYDSWSDYQKLFEDVRDKKVVGEASVWYLYSKAAVREILDVNPNAKFIAMLRCPIKAAQATHGELLLDLREDEPNFEKAWRLQEVRRQGERIPINAREPLHLLYKDVCSWSSQIKRLLDLAPYENVLIIIMEEFFANPDEGYRNVLHFLGVKTLSLSNYPRVNGSKQVKSLWLLKASRELPLLYPSAFRVAKRVANALRIHPGRLLNQYVRNGNIEDRARPKISDDFHQELVNEFRPDVERLEEMLGRSLTKYWFRR